MTLINQIHPHPRGRPPPKSVLSTLQLWFRYLQGILIWINFVLLTLQPWPSLRQSFQSLLTHKALIFTIMLASYIDTVCGKNTISDNHSTLAFTSHMYNASVPENALSNTPVVSETMMGMFLPADNQLFIRYRIIDGDPQKFFKASSRVVGDFCFLELHVQTNNTQLLNREQDSKYILHVKAQERLLDKTKVDIPEAITKVTVYITDLDDLPPIFVNQEYHTRVREDTPIHSSLLKIHAEDPDDGLNGDIYYSVIGDKSIFDVHSTTGVISLMQPLQFLQKATYEFTVEAKDRGSQHRGSAPVTAKVYINVTEENIYDPQIKVNIIEDPTPRSHLATVAEINIIDNDEGPSGEVCILEVVEGDPDMVFRVYQGTNEKEFNLAALDTIEWTNYPYGFNLTLKATDCGHRQRFNYKDLRVGAPLALPLQEPVFTQEVFESSVEEIAPVGTKVMALGAWIPGSQRDIEFKILSGNKYEQFHLDPTSGVLTTAMPLDFENINRYTLNIVASIASKRNSQQQNIAKIHINILDSNDNTPVIVAPQGIVEIDENQPGGTLVTNVRAQDYDVGENGIVSYSLANALEVPFTIDHFTGEVRTTRVLDYETERQIWRLQVRASDWGLPFRRQSEKVITIEVKDVNDNRPKFEEIDCSGFVDRLATPDTEIITLSAVDFDQGNIISYRIVGGNEDRCFNLNPTSGVLVLKCYLQDKQTIKYILNVTATDGRHFADILPIHLEIFKQTSSYPDRWADLSCVQTGVVKQLEDQLRMAKEANREDGSLQIPQLSSVRNAHRPEIRHIMTGDLIITQEVKLKENSEIGSEVFQVVGYDPDTGYEGYLMYVISGGNYEAVFEMNIITGKLTVAGLIDREHHARYVLNITMYDTGDPRYSVSRKIIINIVDENDNAPQFDKAAYSFILPENVPNSTNVNKLTAQDPDEGLNGVVTYSLATDTQDFNLDAVTGRLSVARTLDYENIKLHELKIVATDGGGRSSHTYVSIQIVNVNDCPPMFPDERSNFVVRVPEDLPIGSLVTLIPAHDKDSQQLFYSLEDKTHKGIFTLDPDTAALRLAEPLDYETRPVYNVTIWAADDGSPPLKANCHVIIQVVDINENIHAPVFGQDVLETSVSEDVSPNTKVVSVPALDADMAPLDSSVTYRLVGPEGQGVFTIDHTGTIFTASRLDRETTARYWLTVQAQDLGTVPRQAILHVYVNVLDVNDHIPLSPEPHYEVSVLENSPPGTTVLPPINALDPDPGAQLSYHITAGNPQSLFDIDSESGAIHTTLRRLDREHKPLHVLEITISDSPGDESLMSKTTVTVNVGDENDNVPRFLDRRYKFTLPIREISGLNSNGRYVKIGQVVAVDDDIGNNGNITYKLKEDKWSETFKIDPKTGIIYVIPENFIPEEDYELTVLASDNGVEQRSNSCLVLVRGEQVPSSSATPPTILEPDTSSVTVLESDPIGQYVKLINAQDDDGDTLWFDITGGNEDYKFSIVSDIDSGTGSIMLAQQIDYEVASSYNLTVSVTDGVHIVTCQILVSVLDVNDNPPIFSSEIYEVNVSENTTPGTTVFTLNATDIDSDKYLSFTLFNAAHVASASKFTINRLRGDIVLQEYIDREVQEKHILTICVQDRIAPIKKDFARVIINVLDHNDYTPKFLLPQYNGTVSETAALGTSITQVVALDWDKGPNGHVSYSIVSGNFGNVFALDKESGIISLLAEVDRREMSEYWLAVRGMDGGTPSLYSHGNVNIIVKMAKNASPRFLKKEFKFEVSEKAHIGDYIGILEVESHLGVAFSLFPISSQLPFSINPSSGFLAVDGLLDFEKIQTFNFTVVATSMNGVESITSVMIDIHDENDNIPFFTATNYVGNISEAAAINSVVLLDDNSPLIIKAQDADSGTNAKLIFTIMEEEARNNFTIDSSTGAIRTVSLLDHEVASYMVLTVGVQDCGKPVLSASTMAIINITIGDVNDMPPIFLLEEYNATLFIPTYREIFVVQLNATDLDSGDSSDLKFVIADGNDLGKFKLDENSGIITVNSTKELSSSYHLKVTVSDGHFASSTSVNIQVTKLPDGELQFAQDQYYAAVEENVTSNAKVTMVHVLGSHLNEHLHYSILNPNDNFLIGSTSGVIHTIGRPLDREEKSSYHLIVQVQSLNVGHVNRIAHVQVHIEIMDKNDNSPIFVNTPYSTMISLSTKKEQKIFKVHANDLDSDANGEVRYELVGGDENLFAVSATTGDIVLRKTLDGKRLEYELIIKAHDRGLPSLGSEASVLLKVAQHNQPIFDQQHYSASVKENSVANTPVVTINAVSQLSHKIIYHIVNGNGQQIFSVQSENGIIRVEGKIDFESESVYEVTVRAVDSVSSKWTDALVSINVTDINDNSPQFSQHSYEVTVSEATAIATSVLTVTTTDLDTGLNAGVTYQVLNMNGSNLEDFYVTSDTGILVLRKSLNREFQDKHNFLVVATDTGKPPLSSTAQITVYVSDMNDNAPLFVRSESGLCSISEGATSGQFVTHLPAWDKDVADFMRLTYTIVDGNQQAFNINPTTGIISVLDQQKLSSTTQHILNISVSDGVYSAFTQQTVTVLPVNNHSPTFKGAQYEAKVMENDPPKTKVTQVEADDKDSGHYGVVTYHFIGDEAHKYFRINENTGVVRTTQLLDREAKAEFLYTIMATDSGGRSGFTSLHVVVGDMNDNKPKFLQSVYKTVFKDDVTTGTIVAKVLANDDDMGDAGKITYELHSSTNLDTRSAFAVHNETGDITLLKDAHILGSSAFEIVVKARDHGYPNLHSTVKVLLDLVPSATLVPEFRTRMFTLLVFEDAEPGSVIGSVAVRYDGNVSYGVQWNEPNISPPVTVLADGTLILSTKLDHEVMDRIIVTISAHPINKQKLIQESVLILEVQDVNDEFPVFESQTYYITVAENTQPGSNIIKVHANDADSGSFSEVRYTLEESSPLLEEPLFTLDLYSGWLGLNKHLDAEEKNHYDLIVSAFDGIDPKLKSTAIIKVKVENYNDKAPRFSKNKYSASVKEDAIPGNVVIQLDVIDDEHSTDFLETKNTYHYYLSKGNQMQHFHIRNGGQVYVANKLDRENIEEYNLEVTVTDGFFVATVNVLIEVMDINDHSPECPTPYYYNSISESAGPGTLLLQVDVSDPDLMGKNEFLLTGNGAKSFSLNRNSGKLSFVRPLDRETQSHYLLTAVVQDVDHKEWFCTSHIEIDVTDVNDNSPVFSQDSYSINVPENSAENLLLLKVQAVDPDKDDNGKISYSMEGSHIFSIDKDSGIISVSRSLDRESRAMYNLNVTAQDHGQPPLMNKTRIIVLVSDENDNPPEFVSHTYYTTITESSNLGSEIVHVLATSRDAGKNSEISYSIVTGNEERKFAIHSKTGIVTIKGVLDYEETENYQLIIEAKDGGYPPLFKHATINVTITDVNDNPPVFLQTSYTAFVNEEAHSGQRILQVKATDLDSGISGQVSYRIQDIELKKLFQIDESSGWVMVSGSLDRETRNSYNLEVMALDAGVPQQSASVMVTIDVQDANDNKPTFVGIPEAVYLKENQPKNSLVYQFEVIDEDDDFANNGGPFLFEIRSGNNGEMFRLDEDGRLITANKVKRRKEDNYVLNIRVYDNGRPPLFSETEINIKIVPESQYPPTVEPLSIDVFVKTMDTKDYILGKINASDKDPYDNLRYYIEKDIWGISDKLFTINHMDGTLSSQNSLEEGSYNLTISVSDGRFSTSTQVHIKINDINNNMVANAVIIQLGGATTQEFLTTYKSRFIFAIENILSVTPDNIVIAGLQKANQRYRRNIKKSLSEKSNEKLADIEVLFAVRRSNSNYIPRKLLREKLQMEINQLQNSIGLKVITIVSDSCTSSTCENGECEEHIILDDEQEVVILRDTSFVSHHYHHDFQCKCPRCFSGARCDIKIANCAECKCESFQVCITETFGHGYYCQCPEGTAGPKCNQKPSQCLPPLCYTSVSQLTFKGKSYAQYSLQDSMEKHFSFSVWFRTHFQSGTIFYTPGKMDYSVLKIQGGSVVYMWELGSGEGKVVITTLKVNDGNWHYLALERLGRSANVCVDGKYCGQGYSSGSSELLNVEKAQFFLGAETYLWSGGLEPRVGFVGCIDNPHLGAEPLPLRHRTKTKVSSLLRMNGVTPMCTTILTGVGVCGSYPCLNGGTCHARQGSYVCKCHPGYFGSHCECDTNPCDSMPCMNNGRCVNIDTNQCLNISSSYRCECPVGVAGHRCERFYCNPNPCLNQGVCEEGNSMAICKCNMGFTGDYCQIDINECIKDPCANGATCVNSFGGFQCECLENWTGLSCDVPRRVIIPWILYIVVGGGVVLVLTLMVLLGVCWRQNKAAVQQRQQQQQNSNHLNHKVKHSDVHNVYKLSNLEI